MASKSLVIASTSSSPPPPPPPPRPRRPRWYYEVFLSFRGEDVRKNFVDHLYSALHRNGIFTFKDDERLERGKSIGPELLKSIEQSRFAVVVFSQNYASSSWCLDELAKIIECSKLKGQTVLPFFYNVDPSEVRNQTGDFGKVFAKHDSDKVEIWRAALSKAVNISGWDLNNTADGHESKCIDQIVREILSKRADTISTEDEGLFGMESRIYEVNSLLGTGSNDVRIVGIWGLSGIGKTTLARAIFYQISYRFEAASFLHEVGEASKKHDGLKLVLEKLLSEILMVKDLKINNIFDGINIMKERLHFKRVLLVLDDVDHLKQLEVLAGKRDWFGPGSRIIITTRDKKLLEHEVVVMHKARLLNDGDAINLFSWKAFKDIRPTKDFEELSYQVIQYDSGLPLALRVLGSALYGRDMTMWRSTLDRLIKEGPEGEIPENLKIGFDVLKDSEKKTFLDIACFFEGEEKDYVTKKLDSFGFYPDISLPVLIEKSLIYLLRNRLCMHQLIREMGRHIVRQNNPGDPWKQSRLWLADDILRALKRRRGTEKIEGIQLCLPKRTCIDIKPKAFKEMDRLRLLEIHNACVPQGPKYLPEGLRWIVWDEFPSKSMPPNFQADKLVGLELCRSSIIQLWEEKKMLNNLKYIDLSDSPHLINTPDLTAAPNLETLNLAWCSKLEKLPENLGDLECLRELRLAGTAIKELPSSIGLLTELIEIDLSDCKYLTSLPSTICMLEGLERLFLNGCSKLEKLPENLGDLECLRELCLDGTAIKELPSSIGLLTELIDIDLSDCKNLTSLPSTICMLEGLKTLDVSWCSKLEKLPEDLGDLKCLEELGLERSAIKELPLSIEWLTGITEIDLTDCKYLTSLPSSICKLKGLKTLYVSWCSKLEKLPEDLGVLECLKELGLKRTAIKELPSSIGLLTVLTKIDLEGCKYLTSLPSTICMLKRLEKLILTGCSELEKLPEDLGDLKCLWNLDLKGTAIKELPSSIGLLTSLRCLYLTGCEYLTCLPCTILKLKGLKKLEQQPEELENFECLSNLKSCGTAITQAPPLSFCGCGRKTFESRPRKRQRLSNCELLDGAIPSDLWCLYNLDELNLGGNNFVNIPSINGLSQLRILMLVGCKNLQALPELPSNLVELFADDCKSLRGFSELSNKKLDLRRVSFRNCLQLLEDGQSNNISSILRQCIIQGLSIQDDSPGTNNLRLSDWRACPSIILPGGDILEWFSNQNLGSSISLKLHRNWFNNKFRGFGYSAVFESITKGTEIYMSCGEDIYFFSMRCSVVTPTSTCEFVPTFAIGTEEIIDSQHVCLGFLPLQNLRIDNRKDNPNDWHEVKFFPDSVGVAVVKKWGIRLVYEDDIIPNIVM